MGEILLKGNRKLRTLTFSSFFPAQEYSFADTDDTEPYELVKKIAKFRNDRYSLKVSISGAITFDGVISSFSYSEEDGTGDVSYSITFTEERKIKGKRAEKTVKVKKYVCKKGDNFYKVARKTTGSVSNAKKIAKANKMKVTALPGQEVRNRCQEHCHTMLHTIQRTANSNLQLQCLVT